VFREDGPWWTTALEPNTPINALANGVDANGNILEAGIRYTCDEFPPKTFVEGGDGEGRVQPAQTRCAALRCLPQHKGEQNCKRNFLIKSFNAILTHNFTGQGTAHQNLRAELVRMIRQYHPLQNTFDDEDSIAFFIFSTSDAADGFAAKVRCLHLHLVTFGADVSHFRGSDECFASFQI